jgi:fructokinase
MCPASSHGFDVIGLGEILWDCFPDRRLPGGAPANVAFHAQQLGLSAAVATRVGADPLGDELVRFLESQGLLTDLVQRDPEHGTGTVTVEIHSDRTNYEFLENSAWDFLDAAPDWLAAAESARSIVFGTLAQRRERSRRTIHEMLAAAKDDCLIVYDVNLRPPFFEREWIHESLRRARVAKLNDDEAQHLATLFSTQTRSEDEFARWLLDVYHLDLVCITRGARGALAVSQDELCEVSGIAIQVADTVGAGDAFTAALIWSRFAGRPLKESLELANRFGALVASRPGAMPKLSREIGELLRGR